ncbi:hypothetical protein ABID42_001066 [Arcicella rosea]|uniref:hypothetical protein n=1 Tax=Arcicella rosea TaxID=502909 RepID=UPI00345CDE7E
MATQFEGFAISQPLAGLLSTCTHSIEISYSLISSHLCELKGNGKYAYTVARVITSDFFCNRIACEDTRNGTRFIKSDGAIIYKKNLRKNKPAEV